MVWVVRARETPPSRAGVGVVQNNTLPAHFGRFEGDLGFSRGFRRRAQNFYHQTGNTPEVGFVVWSDQNTESQSVGGGGDGDVVLRDEGTLLGEFGENVCVVLGDERGEIDQTCHPTDCFQP